MAIKKLSGFIFHWVLPLALLGGAAMSVKMLGARQKPSRRKQPPRVSVPVEVVHAERHEGTLNITASGTVVPFREVSLAAEVSGRVVWKADEFLTGEFVTEGSDLLKIDAVDYELEVARLKQQLAKAEADLARVAVDKKNAELLISLARETLELRSRDLERVKALQRTRSTSDTEYDAVQKTYVEAKQQLTTRENELRGLTAESKGLKTARELASIGLEIATRNLDRTVITAPFSGVVIAHMVEANSHVKAGDIVARVEDTSRVEVRCNLRKEDLEFLPRNPDREAARTPSQAYRLPPLPVTVRYTRAGRNYSWQGVLSRQDGLGMDERTRTMPVRIRVDEPLNGAVDTTDPRARPIPLVRGMFVTVDLHCQPDRALLAIPEGTIRPGKAVWLMEDERLTIQPIHIVRIEDGMAYVDARGSMLNRGHSIISSPVPGAKEGLAVTTSSPQPAAEGPGGGKRGPAGNGRRRGPDAGGDGRPGLRQRDGVEKQAARDQLKVAQDEGA